MTHRITRSLLGACLGLIGMTIQAQALFSSAPLNVSFSNPSGGSTLLDGLSANGIGGNSFVCTPANAGNPSNSKTNNPCGSSNPATLNAGSSVNQGVGNPINVLNGNKYQREVDMPALPGVLGLEIVRHYNSLYSKHSMITGILGRGWRLSYETDLYVMGNTLQIIQADGSRVLFKCHLNDCSAINPLNGAITIEKTSRGNEYRWLWLNGRVLHFDTQGKLEQILAPTGEFVSLIHDAKGFLVRVTDPQGRTLHLNYMDKETAKRSTHFRGVQSMDSPVGRYTYEYGSELPKGSKVEPIQLAANLVKVGIPTHYDDQTPVHAYANRGVSSSSISRIYHYEEARFPTLLTGITVSGTGSDGVLINQRISSWGYDAEGRAVLSVKGSASDKLERVELNFAQPNTTVLTNSLGQKTTYCYETIAGEYRLLEVRGVGCATCGESNVRYGYDNLGRLIESIALNEAGQPLQALKVERDVWGRVLKLSRVAYINGKAMPAEWFKRFEYANPTLEPSLIASPSVVASMTPPHPSPLPQGARGQKQATLDSLEHQIRITYNEAHQPLTVTETGWSPKTSLLEKPLLPQAGEGGDEGAKNVLDASKRQRLTNNSSYQTNPEATYALTSVLSRLRERKPNLSFIQQPSKQSAQLTRTTTYHYTTLNGRSVLTQIDNPLPNGPKATAHDSDITQFKWDARADYTVATITPGNIRTTIKRDEAGRPIQITKTEGTRRLQTNFIYTPQGQIQSATDTAWLIDNPSSPLSRSLQWFYNAQGQLSKVLDTANRPITMNYDTAGHLTTLTDIQGYRSQLMLDGEGHVQIAGWYEPNQTQPLRAIYRWFDDYGRITRQLRPDGRLDTATYNANGERQEHIDGDDIRHITRSNADTSIQIDQAPDGDLRVHLNSPEDSIRDDFGRVVQVNLPGHGLKTAYYDAANRLIEQRNADGSGSRFEYDFAGRLIQKTVFDAHKTYRMTLRYDGLSLIEITDPNQTTTYTLDAFGRRIQTRTTLAGHTFTTGTTFDPTGLPAEQLLADGRIMRIEREPQTLTATQLQLRTPFWTTIANRLPKAIGDWLPTQTIVQDISIHPFNGLTSFAHGNNLNTQKIFDSAGRLTRQTIQGKQSLTDARYTYNTGSKIQKQNDTSYTYSSFGALLPTRSQNPSPSSLSLNSLAPRGRGLGRGGSQVPTQLSSIQRDSLGRTTADAHFLYTYTLESQIETITEAQSHRLIARYAYNALNQRISKTVFADNNRSTTTYFLWQHNRLVAEINDAGHITAQYLYLSEGSQAMPIAKLETQSNQPERLLAIHADHRGEPFAMTDADQKTVWKATITPWGAAEQIEGSATLNLRLPGQYFDQESGLHDNVHRSYDPRPDSPNFGRYLQPDPLGYPDGPDAYLYASGDPVNRVDPLGLYEEDVHYYMTYFLAIASGIDRDSARTIALAAQYIDDNPKTYPLSPSYTGSVTDVILHNSDAIQRLSSYHFTEDGYDVPRNAIEQSYFNNTGRDLLSYVQRRIKDPRNPQLEQLLNASTTAHSDKSANCNASLQLFGEYLHAFEDTFGHRSQQNNTISLNDGLGHYVYAHEPDYTYNHWGTLNPFFPNAQGFWGGNEFRTLEMEKEVFSKMAAIPYKTGKVTDFNTIKNYLMQFNATHENSGTGFNEKLNILNKALVSMGYSGFDFNGRDSYNQSTAAKNRVTNLKGLDPKKYPGVIF